MGGDKGEGRFLGWVRNNEPGLFDNVGLSNLTKFLTDRQNLLPYMDIPWIAYGVEHAEVELLLGDRPVWTHRRPVDPDFMVVLPLPPLTSFFAPNPDPLIKKLIDAAAS